MHYLAETAIKANDRKLAIQCWVEDALEGWDWASASAEQIIACDLDIDHKLATHFNLRISEAEPVIEKMLKEMESKKTPVKISDAAALMGRKGGAAKTPEKAAASRKNGKKGGRPPKNAPSHNETYFAYGGTPMVQTCIVCGKPYSGENTVSKNVGYGRYRDFPAHKKCEIRYNSPNY